MSVKRSSNMSTSESTKIVILKIHTPTLPIIRLSPSTAKLPTAPPLAPKRLDCTIKMVKNSKIAPMLNSKNLKSKP